MEVSSHVLFKPETIHSGGSFPKQVRLASGHKYLLPAGKCGTEGVFARSLPPADLQALLQRAHALVILSKVAFATRIHQREIRPLAKPLRGLFVALVLLLDA